MNAGYVMRVAASLITAAQLWSSCATAQEAARFRAGAAISNITPDIGGDIIGGFTPIVSKHIHDDLHVRCLVLDDGQTRLAFAVCDLVGISKMVCDEACRTIQERTAIPAGNVLICATHTHSATSALGSNRFQRESELDEYQRFVARRIADGVQRANNLLRPAEFAFGTVDIPEHVFNRRWFMRPGTVPENPFGGSDLVKMNPGAGNPNLTEPAGPTDPTLSFLALREPNGRPIAVFASYSLHYVGGVGPGHISADYFAMFSETLKSLVQTEPQDPPFVAMLSNGTSGDINNINFKTPRPSKPPYEQMRFVADDVAGKVHAALAQVKYGNNLSLDARSREVPIGWRKPTPEQLAWAKKTLAERPADSAKADLPRIYAERAQRLAEFPDTMPMPLQVFRIGDVFISTMPCEVFCEIGLEFKEKAPSRNAFLISLTHGAYGYLPTPRHHDLGGYETWLGTNRLERTASEKMLAQLLEMAREMSPTK
jgi:neutral ceramidase